VSYKYARHPGTGIAIGAPIPITLGEADRLVETLQQKRRVAPYIPLFYDCRTFVCRVQEKARGRSGIRCHLLFKGYW
jgi:hypothetical protein